MSPRQYVIALDIGGTGMKAALIDSDNRPLHEARRRTHAERGPDAVLNEVLDFAEELRRTGVDEYATPPVAAGVAVPGVIDEATGTVTFAANLAWREVPLRSLLVERLGMPVALGHDVRTGGLAEGRLGAGEGTDRFLFVPIGTGIAGAIGIDGRVEAGAHGGAGEIGHVVVDPEGPECGCGQRGCLEALASAAAVGRDWAAVCGNPAATAADAAKAVASGDVRALAVWQKAVDRLAGGLVMACTLLDPRTLIVGGGLAEAGETLFGPLRDAVHGRVTFQHPPTIVPAALGDAAGCLGAGLLAWDLLSAEVSRR